MRTLRLKASEGSESGSIFAKFERDILMLKRHI